MEKRFILIAPGYPYNDSTSAGTFVNSVSEPVTELEAKRMEACMGCVVLELPNVEMAEAVMLESREKLTADNHYQIRVSGSQFIRETDVTLKPQGAQEGPLETVEVSEDGPKLPETGSGKPSPASASAKQSESEKTQEKAEPKKPAKAKPKA